MDGAHVKVVSERAGHANVSITLGVYAAFILTLQADAAAGVDAWLRQSLAEQVGGNWRLLGQAQKTKPLRSLVKPG
jgi:hypothetical protein